jgi:predicted ABC-type ATPase
MRRWGRRPVPSGRCKIIIIAGPNGAGKTSFASEYLPAERESLVYLNADEIAREISEPTQTQAQLDLRAGREMLSRIIGLVGARTEFMFETTLASLSYAAKLPVWHAQGYTVALIYLRLQNVEMSIDRVRRRVAAGGHGIPETVIRQRFANRTTSRSSMSGMFGIAWKASFYWQKLGTTDGQGGQHRQSARGPG